MPYNVTVSSAYGTRTHSTHATARDAWRKVRSANRAERRARDEISYHVEGLPPDRPREVTGYGRARSSAANHLSWSAIYRKSATRYPRNSADRRATVDAAREYIDRARTARACSYPYFTPPAHRTSARTEVIR